MNRAATTVLLAVVLIVAVLAVTAIMTFAGLANTAKFGYDEVWRQDYPGALSLKIIDLTGDEQDDLFAQNLDSVSIYAAGGDELFRQDYSSGVSTTMGDVNGDSVEDVVVFDASGIFALRGTGEALWEAQPADVGVPYRAAVIRFRGGRQVVLGDDAGQVIALDSGGQELWRGATTIVDYIRGLDEVLVDGEYQAAVANHNGLIKVFDERGQARWEYSLTNTLRRMRAYDLDGDGTGEILAGGDGNRLVMLSADTGEERLNRSLGQAITEIREVELDGEPASREFVVGGKDGGVWAFSASGSELWSASLPDRVNEIAGIDLDDDGAQEVIVGDETGLVVVFSGRGNRATLGNWSSAIGRIDAGRLTGLDQVVVADANSLSLLRLRKVRAPLWYTPLLAGLIVSFVIAFAAWFIATLPPKPVLRASAEDQSVEGLLARNRMLHESLADVERLRGTNEMPAEAYLSRLKDLRGQLADTQGALLKSGHNIRLETFKCPNCGGALPLGLDKCEYCGQVVIA